MSQISFNCQASMWSAFLFTPSYERGPAYEEAIRKNNPGTREVWLRCVYYFFVPRSRKAATSLSAPGRKLTLSTADFFFSNIKVQAILILQEEHVRVVSMTMWYLLLFPYPQAAQRAINESPISFYFESWCWRIKVAFVSASFNLWVAR